MALDIYNNLPLITHQVYAENWAVHTKDRLGINFALKCIYYTSMFSSNGST